MITFYCPACWAEIAEGERVCPACGAVREVLEQRSYTQKLIAALSHPEPQTPIRAAWLLGKFGAAEAVEPLLALVRYPPDPYIQAAAVEALGRIGGPGVRDILQDLVATGPVLARGSARAALREIDDAERTSRRRETPAGRPPGNCQEGPIPWLSKGQPPPRPGAAAAG